jgi:hypothetical protein
MMTDWEREKFTHETATRAAETLARGDNLRLDLAPLFRQALLCHPDEEDRLIELWDKLTSRPVL